MRQIIEYSLEQGVVPILATKGDNLEGDHSINAEIAEIAVEYDIPLWNFWAALQPLPNQGHSTELNDGFHLSFSRNFFDKEKNQYILSEKTAKKLLSENSPIKIYRVEEFPTYDRIEVEKEEIKI